MSPGDQKQESRRHGWRLLVVVIGMFAFGFALGPMYTMICKFTGINGKTNGIAITAAELPKVDESRWVNVVFVTTVNGGRPWKFRAEQAQVRVHPGQLTTVGFYAQNTQDTDVIAQAVPNIAPWNAAKYLHKTECFCFNNQAFKAGEEKHMPVRFVLDPELPQDVDTVTLSYTFFDVTQSAAKAASTQPRS